MVAELASAIASLKSAIDIIKGFNSLQLDVAVKEKSIELLNIIISLQANILSVQSDYSELLDSKSKIEKELVELKSFIDDRSNYSLVEITSGLFAYMKKLESNTKGTKHYFCQSCFDNKNQKSILQKKYAEHNDLICNSCKTTFRIADDKDDTEIIFRA